MIKISIPQERRYDLDLLRLIAILILLFFHTGMWFNTWGWHVKNAETSTFFNYWMVWLHYWRMPLLLFISGAGTFMALGKRTPVQYRRERFLRLFIPLVFGVFVIVPPQIYYEHIKEYSSYKEFYLTVFNFVPYPKGSLSWHHLWFILYLFLYSLMALPFLKFLRSENSIRFKEQAQRLLSKPMAMLLLPALFILGTQVALRPIFPDETHDLLHDWAFFVFYFCFFLFGILCYSIRDLWLSIGHNSKYLLAGSLVILIPFYICYFSFYGLLEIPLSVGTIETIFDVLAILLSWFTVITVIAYGQRWLNKPHRWLPLVNEGLYPFYILHQTVIIVIGYYVCQLPWSIAAKFWTIALLTASCCCLFFLLLIRPFNPVRILFGVKPRK